MCDAKLKKKMADVLTTLNLTPYSNIRYIYAKKNVYTHKIKLESHNINIIGF